MEPYGQWKESLKKQEHNDLKKKKKNIEKQ